MKWRDQHLKTCACKRCAAKPTFVPDNPVLNAKAQALASEYRDEIVYDGKDPWAKVDTAAIQKALDAHVKAICKSPLPSPSHHAPLTWGSLADYTSKPVEKIVYDATLPYMISVDPVGNSVKVNPNAMTASSGITWADSTTITINGTWEFQGSVLTGPGTITWGSGAAWAPPEEPPTVELLDSGNPFSRVLDAWQTGKAGWTKGVTFRRQPQQEEVPA